MGAMAKPKGAVPEKQGKDVNAESSSASAQEETQQASSSKATSAKEEVTEAEGDLEETDLQELAESKKIPYTRFKQVNEEKKGIQAQLAEAQRLLKEEQLKRLAIEEEAKEAHRLKAQITSREEEDLDPWERTERKMQNRIQQLEAQLEKVQSISESTSFQAEMERLQKRYPDADPLAVQGWKKVRPHADLEELMEFSHNQNVERAETKLKELLDRKKQRAKQAIPTIETGIRLKDDERPKTLKEAHKLAMKWAGLGKR